MSSEPERPVEKLLRAWAKARRERGDQSWEIHPATRRILQREVARRFAERRSAPNRWWSWMFGHGWMRPISALTAVAFVFLTSWILVYELNLKRSEPLLADNQRAIAPAEPSRLLAENKSEASREEELKSKKSQVETLLDKEKAGAAPSQVPAGSAKDTTYGLHTGLARDEKATVGQNPITKTDADSPPALAQNTVQLKNFSAGRGLPQEAGPAPALAPSPASAPSAEEVLGRKPESESLRLRAPSASAALNQEARQSSFAVTAGAPVTNVLSYGRFDALAALDTNAKPVAQFKRALSVDRAQLQNEPVLKTKNQVLRSFLVEQSGADVRVIDTDGSVYAGSIQAAPLQTSTLTENTQRAAALDSASVASPGPALPGLQGQSSSAITFQVLGTNRSSKQRVLFTATLTPDTNAIVGAQVMQAVGGLAKAAQLSVTNSLSSALRLTGRAVIDDQPELEIDAVQIPETKPTR